jgi:ribosomal silencing factor RsfS
MIFPNIYKRLFGRQLPFNPRLVKIKKLLTMTREEKKAYILSKYPTDPEEYLPRPMQPMIPVSAKSPTVAYELNRTGLCQLVKDEVNKDLEFIKVPGDRGLPFDNIVIVELEQRRARLALLEKVMGAFRKLKPTSDYNRTVNQHNKGEKTSSDDDWIIVNIPKIAALHIMHPNANLFYNLKELYEQKEK